MLEHTYTPLTGDVGTYIALFPTEVKLEVGSKLTVSPCWLTILIDPEDAPDDVTRGTDAPDDVTSLTGVEGALVLVATDIPCGALTIFSPLGSVSTVTTFSTISISSSRLSAAMDASMMSSLFCSLTMVTFPVVGSTAPIYGNFSGRTLDEVPGIQFQYH